MQLQSPDDICDTLGLCTSKKVSIRSTGTTNSLLCEVCDIVVYLVHNFVFTNKTEVCSKQTNNELNCNIVQVSYRMCYECFIVSHA